MNDKEKILRKQRLQARKTLENVNHLPFKSETTAKWCNIKRKWNGSILVQIEHDTIKGVNPEMMQWWFENLSQTTRWNGIDFSGPEIFNYHLWHHRDHIAVTPLNNAIDGRINRGFLEGCDSKIEEIFNEVHFHVNTRMHTTKLDDKEFTFLIKAAGLTIGHITHLYTQENNGLAFYAETEIGCQIPIIGWFLNCLILPFIYNKKTGMHWIKHNIEETGRTEDILPILYANRKNTTL